MRAQELKKNPGSSKFIEKYERLVGKETGKEAARVLEVNKQFGIGMYIVNMFTTQSPHKAK